MSPNQSPINLSLSTSKPCDLLCELVMDNAYISQANAIVSDEGLILQSETGLGSCKFNGEGYTCKYILVNHPSHHTIENIQADAEVIAVFTNPNGEYLFVSSLVRVNPSQTQSSHFFNAFVPYANPSAPYTTVNLGEQWGLFMMVPPSSSYFVYDGSSVVPPCVSAKWVVFKSMINIDSNDFALLVKNVTPGSRPIQPIGDREVFYNDSDQLSGGPMPRDGKIYIRFKRIGKKKDTSIVERAPLKEKQSQESSKRKNFIQEWASDQIEMNGFIGFIDLILTVGALILGIWYGWKVGQSSSGLFLVYFSEKVAAWIRSLFIRT